MPNLEPPPRPPFTMATAIAKVRLAEDAWNTRDPARVRWPTRPPAGGGTGPNSSKGARRSSLF